MRREGEALHPTVPYFSIFGATFSLYLNALWKTESKRDINGLWGYDPGTGSVSITKKDRSKCHRSKNGISSYLVNGPSIRRSRF